MRQRKQTLPPKNVSLADTLISPKESFFQGLKPLQIFFEYALALARLRHLYLTPCRL